MFALLVPSTYSSLGLPSDFAREFALIGRLDKAAEDLKPQLDQTAATAIAEFQSSRRVGVCCRVSEMLPSRL